MPEVKNKIHYIHHYFGRLLQQGGWPNSVRGTLVLPLRKPVRIFRAAPRVWVIELGVGGALSAKEMFATALSAVLCSCLVPWGPGARPPRRSRVSKTSKCQTIRRYVNIFQRFLRQIELRKKISRFVQEQRCEMTGLTFPFQCLPS